MLERLPELLSPAGSPEAARAALRSGADALYLGASAFGARAQAGFDEAALRQIIRECHFAARRVYVTVNTLVKENELPALAQTLEKLCEWRADAVLVQDMGALQLARERFPALCLHASTQMALHSAQDARTLKALGVSRVVLARECPLETIRAVARVLPCEVFVHGAQCAGVSGQCRFSGLAGGRSGNRGRCAQPCRMRYTLNGESGAWLSPRDLCLRDRLPALIEAGVCSLKIEGRLKRPEYVAVVTRAYRRALDACAQGRFAPADEAERETLAQVFSRSFFPGYAFGAQDAAVVNPLRTSSQGIPLGTLTRVWQSGDQILCEAALARALHDGDGLQIRGQSEQDLVYSGPPRAAGETAVLRLHARARAGDAVARIDDEALLALARREYESAPPPVPFDAVLTARPGETARLTVTDGVFSACVAGETVQKAENAALNVARARQSLAKTGGTPYALRQLTLEGENAYLSPAALNALRRRALEALYDARVAAHPLPRASTAPPLPVPGAYAAAAPRLFAQICDASMAEGLLRAGAEEIIFSPVDWRAPALEKALSQLPEGAYIALPVQIGDPERARVRALAKARGFRLCLNGVGQPDGGEALLGEGAPVWNHRASDLLCALGGAWQTLPRELSAREIEALAAAASLPPDRFLLPVYGRARLMYLNHCPVRVQRGLSHGRADCALCARGQGCRGRGLTGAQGEVYPFLPVRFAQGCLIALLASRIRSLNARADRRFSWLLDFTLETTEEALTVTRAYRARRDGAEGESVPGILERYDRGVE